MPFTKRCNTVTTAEKPSSSAELIIKAQPIIAQAKQLRSSLKLSSSAKLSNKFHLDNSYENDPVSVNGPFKEEANVGILQTGNAEALLQCSIDPTPKVRDMTSDKAATAPAVPPVAYGLAALKSSKLPISKQPAISKLPTKKMPISRLQNNKLHSSVCKSLNNIRQAIIASFARTTPHYLSPSFTAQPIVPLQAMLQAPPPSAVRLSLAAARLQAARSHGL